MMLTFNALSGNWWPYVYVTIGAPVVCRQFLCGRDYDAVISSTVFGGLFIVAEFDVDWPTILTIIFSVSAIFILFKEFCNPNARKEVEREESDDLENSED